MKNRGRSSIPKEREKKKNRKSNYFIKIFLWEMMRDNKEGIEARVPVKKRKNTSIDSFFNRVSFLLASLPSPPPLPFSKGKKKKRKKRRTLASVTTCISRTFTRTKKRTLEKTRTRIAFFTWIYIPYTSHNVTYNNNNNNNSTGWKLDSSG